jgi:hypothetical protein
MAKGHQMIPASITSPGLSEKPLSECGVRRTHPTLAGTSIVPLLGQALNTSPFNRYGEFPFIR